MPEWAQFWSDNGILEMIARLRRWLEWVWKLCGDWAGG